MSNFSQKISPIKMLNSPQIKSFQTPAKYLTQRNDTIYEEEYFKLKCGRLDKENQQLHEYVRILQTQNKQLKTQIQYYRQHQSQPNQIKNTSRSSSPYEHRRDISNISFKDEGFAKYEQKNLPEVQKLIQQIRALKITHQNEITSYKTQKQKLNERILQLEDNLHQKEKQWQQKCQNAQKSIQQKNKQLQKEVKELRKSVVVYMQQRDQNQNSLQSLKRQNEMLNEKITHLTERQQFLLEEKNQLQQTIKQKDQEIQNQLKRILENQKNKDQIDVRSSNIRDSVYEYGLKSRKKDKIKESNFSIHTFNGNRHVLAEEAFQVSQSLKNEIYMLQKQLQNQQITHQKEVNDLKFLIQRGEKEIKQKEADLVSLLTKVKPLMLEKHKMTTKQNISPSKAMKQSFQEAKQTLGKNAFGLRMLDLYLKKYKMQAF